VSHTLKLTISEGCLRGKESSIRLSPGLELAENAIAIAGYDVFIFGRAADCGICLPEDDGLVSRHHLVLEVNPPVARIRDLGSLNGTRVNGRKIGGRAKGQTPDEGRQESFPAVELKSGDKIAVGQSLFTVTIQSHPVCWCCGAEIPAGESEKFRESTGAFAYALCGNCMAMAKPADQPTIPEANRPARRCHKCGQTEELDSGGDPGGDYVCPPCREHPPAAPTMVVSPTPVESSPTGPGDSGPAIPGYQLGKRLGKGGFGAVYLAKQVPTGAAVAIKVMLAKVAVSQKARNDFLRETNATKALRHPNIIALLDHGAVGATFYFVMEYCPAGSLADLIYRHGGRLSLPQAAPIMLDALAGLKYCHEQNVVHRDLKPDNILLVEAPEGGFRAKIADLGLAKNFTSAGLSGMTLTGQFAGTYHYMAREQLIQFKFMRPASDVWSIGATFYRALTGCLPHDFPPGKDPAKVVLQDEVVPIRERDASIPKAIANVLDRALAIQPAGRYKHAGEMWQALTSALSLAPAPKPASRAKATPG
jgi:hypothetical protein